MVNGNIIKNVRTIAIGATPIVVGTALITGTLTIAVLGQGNVWLGWGMVGFGLWDLFNNFTSG